MRYVTVRDDILQRCIEALEYRAHMEAGQSQAPDLFAPEDTDDWETAQDLRSALIRMGEPR